MVYKTVVPQYTNSPTAPEWGTRQGKSRTVGLCATCLLVVLWKILSQGSKVGNDGAGYLASPVPSTHTHAHITHTHYAHFEKEFIFYSIRVRDSHRSLKTIPNAHGTENPQAMASSLISASMEQWSKWGENCCLPFFLRDYLCRIFRGE